MPPKKAKKTGKDAKASPKPAESPVKDGSDKTPKKPSKSPSPAKPATPAAGKKRKRADEEDEESEEDDRSPPRSKYPKKPKLSPKTARRVKQEAYLSARIKDLGIKVEPVKGHEPDDEDEDRPEEDWNSMDRVRQRCDDRLDDIEEAVRALGGEILKQYKNLPELDVSEQTSDETRHEKRQKNKKIKIDEEIDPIAEKKHVKKSKNFPDGKKYISAKQLGNIVKILERELGEELARRRVQHPNDVSLATHPSKRARKAKAAAKATGEPPKLTRTLDKQWEKHGLSLRELLDLYNKHGSKASAPARDDLIKKCKGYRLSTTGDLWSLEKAILMYELSSKQRMYGLSPEAIRNIISALGDIEAPGVTEEDDDGSDSSNDAAGPYANLKTNGKGKGEPKDGTASFKGDKKKGKEAGSSPAKDGSNDGKKDGKKNGKKEGKKDDKKDDKKGGKKDDKKGDKKGGKKDDKKDGKKGDKTTGAGTKGTKRRTRSEKTIDPGVEDNKLIDQEEITITDGGQTQRFTQVDVSPTGLRCMWNAVQLLWIGRQTAPGKRVADRYPVNDRVRDLWNAVMHPTEGTTNPARQSRLRLYTALQRGSLDRDNTRLEQRITSRRMGDSDMLQVVADALDIEIFMYCPQYDADGSITWERYVRGQPQSDSARQIHIANYMHVEHWTALTPVGAGPITLPALGEMHRHPIFGSDIPMPTPLTRLQPGDEDNTDLRDEDLHDEPEDGHVADTTEMEEEVEDDDSEDEEEDEEMGEEEEADGNDGPPPPPAAGAAAASASSAAARRTSPSASHPSRSSSAPASTGRGSHSPSGSQKRARRRARSRSKSKSRSTSQPSGVQKNVQPSQPLSKKALKKKSKALRKIFQNFYLAMPSPQNMAGAAPSPYLRSAVPIA